MWTQASQTLPGPCSAVRPGIQMFPGAYISRAKAHSYTTDVLVTEIFIFKELETEKYPSISTYRASV